MLTRRRNSTGAFSRLTVPLRLLALVAASAALSGFDSCEGRKNRKNQQPTTGRIEVSTQPGGYPITIGGRLAGETTDTVRVIELEPGAHTVEILFPSNTRWVREFNIVAGQKQCVAINYRPQTIRIPPGGQTGGKVETVEPGKVSPTGAITLEADTQVVTRCLEAGAAANSRVRLRTRVAAPDSKPLQYGWKVSGGRIEGEGAEVVWDLSGARPGHYDAAVEVEGGPASATVFTSTKVVVRECPASPGPEQPETVDVGNVTGTVADCGELSIPEGGFFPAPAPTPQRKKKR